MQPTQTPTEQLRLRLPKGEVAVKVAFICNALLSGIPYSRFAKPSVRGLDVLDRVPSFSFFIEHPPSGRRVLFDLGVRKDPHLHLSPVVAQRLVDEGWSADLVDRGRDVPEILQENGVSLESVEAVIWSHWHWDHVGDTSRLPNSVRLIVGPAFKQAMLAGYPQNPKSPILESGYSGREILELTDFVGLVGGLEAYDYFGDGSFYLLSTPGHAVGHL